MKNANDDFRDYIGTSQYYRYNFGTKLTDGSKALAEKYECFWLLDIIVSYQLDVRVKHEKLQVWKLKKKGEGAVVNCEDGNYNLILSQKVPYTDFKPDKAELWYQNGVIFLPSEY